MTHFRLIGIKLGEGLKYDTTINEIGRMARAIFDFSVSSHPIGSITSTRSQLIYDWVLTLAEQPVDEESKLQLLQDFIDALTPVGSPLRNLIQEAVNPSELDFWSMVHESVVKVAKDKFEGGYHADAVESSFKEINARVKEILRNRTGKELDGASLMTNAFSEKSPVIVLADLSTETGRNIQKGFMQIFAGAMTGIRNPHAHENIPISREKATHFIFLASLLMHKLDCTGLIEQGIFDDESQLSDLLSFLSSQVFPGETFDGMFGELAERGYSDQQYQAVFDMGLIEYHDKMMNHNVPGEPADWGTFGWLELTPEGQKILDTYQKEEGKQNASHNTRH
uniref:Conserved hypothetical protein CHP02391 domain-containing protein n=1 Tax=Candidatus Methanogaster sp. ANME-2c ERB4 TaxID=2759911 RepID=A0A7G9YHU4_9EURY|nr:hypothetical protein HEDHIHPB_00007 [Methanosarcinales archaeon ANME-2c ERB4]